MPFRDGMALLDRAQEHDRREYYYRQWLAYLPNMTKDTYIPFEDFYQERQQPQIDLRPKDEIMKDIYGGRW